MGANQITELTFIDVETTAIDGPAAGTDALIEIGAARVRLSDRAIVDSFECLIKPHGPQSFNCGYGIEWALGEYHVTAGHFAGVDWSTGLELPHALDIMAGRFLQDGATIAGQNPGFDLRHFRRDWPETWAWPKLDYHVIDLCSPALFLVMAGIVPGVSLRNVIPWAYGEPNHKQAHRAMGDVRDAIQVFWAMFDYYTTGSTPDPWVSQAIPGPVTTRE